MLKTRLNGHLIAAFCYRDGPMHSRAAVIADSLQEDGCLAGALDRYTYTDLCQGSPVALLECRDHSPERRRRGFTIEFPDTRRYPDGGQGRYDRYSWFLAGCPARAQVT